MNALKAIRRPLPLTALVAGLALLLPPALARFGPEPARQFLHAAKLGALGDWLGAGAGGLAFVTTHRKLGELEGRREIEFPFENTGQKPVSLVRAWTSCGCVQAAVPRGSIAPGAKGKVVLHFDATQREKGSTWQLAKIFSDQDPDRPYVLMIEGVVR